jgi:tRNA 2-thiouridine synthesizing protein A
MIMQADTFHSTSSGRPGIGLGLPAALMMFSMRPDFCFSPGIFLPIFLTVRSSSKRSRTMNTHATQSLDARGLNCPLPILRTKKALTAMSAGETLAVTSTDPGSVKDIQAFCKQTGHELISSATNQGEFEFLIRKA